LKHSAEKCPDLPLGLPSFLFIGYCGFFPQWSIGQAVKVTARFCLVPRLRVYLYFYSILYNFMAWTGMIVPLPLPIPMPFAFTMS